MHVPSTMRWSFTRISERVSKTRSLRSSRMAEEDSRQRQRGRKMEGVRDEVQRKRLKDET